MPSQLSKLHPVSLRPKRGRMQQTDSHSLCVHVNSHSPFCPNFPLSFSFVFYFPFLPLFSFPLSFSSPFQFFLLFSLFGCAALFSTLSESAHFSIRCMDCVRSHSRSTQQTTHNTQHTTHKANNTRRIERRQYARSPLSSAPCILLSLSLFVYSFALSFVLSSPFVAWIVFALTQGFTHTFTHAFRDVQLSPLEFDPLTVVSGPRSVLLSSSLVSSCPSLSRHVRLLFLFR
jgi:hypothetical protein